MRIINFSEARDNLKAVIDQVVEDADVAFITRRDAPDAVLMSLDQYNSLIETVHLFGSPANAAHLARSIAQVQAGEAKHRDLIDVPDDEDPDAEPEIHR
jgi:antitoxin YefM